MIGRKHDPTVGAGAERLAAEINAALEVWIEAHKRAPNSPPDLRQFTIETLMHAVALLKAGALGESGSLTMLNELSPYGRPMPYWDGWRRLLRVGNAR